MGGSTAYRFAAQRPGRVRNVALLAPALMLADEQVRATAASAASGDMGSIVYNYRSESESFDMCELVGWPELTSRKLAPLLAVARAEHPEDYWAKIWLAFVGAWKGETREARSAMDLFLSHMQGVAEHGVALRAAGTRVLVVQGTEDRVVSSDMPKVPTVCLLCVFSVCIHVHTYVSIQTCAYTCICRRSSKRCWALANVSGKIWSGTGTKAIRQTVLRTF